MSKLWMKWFGGMVPRRGEQHLTDKRLEETGYFRQPQVNPNFEIESGINATEAENCNLYSGELRPLKKPALAHTFCRPGDECWRVPIPDDPSVPPPEPPPEPPNCIPVVITGQPGPDVCRYYVCDSLQTAIFNVGPRAYWQLQDAVKYPMLSETGPDLGRLNNSSSDLQAPPVNPDACPNYYSVYTSHSGSWYSRRWDDTRPPVTAQELADLVQPTVGVFAYLKNGARFGLGTYWSNAYVGGGGNLISNSDCSLSHDGTSLFFTWPWNGPDSGSGFAGPYGDQSRLFDIDIAAIYADGRPHVFGFIITCPTAPVTWVKDTLEQELYVRVYVDYVLTAEAALNPFPNWPVGDPRRTTTVQHNVDPARNSGYTQVSVTKNTSTNKPYWSDTQYYDRLLSDVELAYLNNAYLQGFTGYVDPNLECRDPL